MLDKIFTVIGRLLFSFFMFSFMAFAILIGLMATLVNAFFGKAPKRNENIIDVRPVRVWFEK